MHGRIVDPQDGELSLGQQGELVVRGPINMLGYLGDMQSSGKAFINGWLRTGDMAHFGKGEELYIVSRQKVIRRSLHM